MSHFGIDPRVPPIYGSGSSRGNSRPSTSISVNVPNFGLPSGRPVTSRVSQRPPPPFAPYTPRSSRTAPVTPRVPAKKKSIHSIFDKMMMNTHTQSLNHAIEIALKELYDSQTSIIWFNYLKDELYSPTLSRVIETNKGIVGYSWFTHEILNLPMPSKHKKFDVTVDHNQPTLVVPFILDDNSVCAVSQITRTSRNPFNDYDIKLAKKFVKKFKMYAHFLLPDLSLQNVSVDISRSNLQPYSVLMKALKNFFKCRVVEFWKADDILSSFSRFDNTINGFRPLVSFSPGAVRDAFERRMLIQITNVTKFHSYFQEIDGDVSESVLMLPIDLDGQLLVVVLRGRSGSSNEFSNQDALMLVSLVPLITKTIDTPSNLSDNEFANRLQALLEVAEIISGVLDIDELIPTIMERACQLLNTERCSLFLIDKAKKELITRFHGGMDQAIRVPLNRGIVGNTATTGNIINIDDVYKDPRFDSSVDKATGFKTRNILTVPIYNNRGEIAGVTEMINKIDSDHFDDDDIKMLMAFNVFCGISLDNARLYATSIELTRQIRGFVEISSTLNETTSGKTIVEGILENALSVINANRATVFLYDQDNKSVSQFASTGTGVQHGAAFAELIIESKKPRIYKKSEIPIILQTGSLDDIIDVGSDASDCSSTSSMSRLSSVLVSDVNNAPEMENEVSICCLPIFRSDHSILGVLEISSNSKVLPEDIKLLDCFAVFTAFSIEKTSLQEIAEHGHVEIKIKKYMTPEERNSHAIPSRLRIPPKEQSTIFSIGFDAQYWDGIGLFKCLWALFDNFNLFKEFQITNEKFFRFIQEISSTYNKVPYHNWRHAVDVTQFIVNELKISKLDQRIDKFHLFGLLVASICHDANHDGFTNVYNVKAETPLGILFKNQSVMETHHCTVAIRVLSSEETNLFSTFSPAEVKEIWATIIQLILVTDMAKHHDFLQSVNQRLDKGPFGDTPEDRLTLMMLCLKCADISNVSRPFELADKWCDVLCEEFFRQGDLERTSGMEYTSDLNDREHLNKPKSQIGFYTFVCLPLYQTAARAIPALEVNVKQVLSNLAIWKQNNELANKEK